MDPCPEVRIKRNCLYLQKAIEALKELEVKIYPPSEEKRKCTL